MAPSSMTRRTGLKLSDSAPSAASFSIFFIGYLLWPAKRAPRAYSHRRGFKAEHRNNAANIHIPLAVLTERVERARGQQPVIGVVKHNLAAHRASSL